MTRVAVIGGGVMGLTIAFELAYQSGLLKNRSAIGLDPTEILLVDQNAFVESASHQATGILATHGAEYFLSPLRRQIVESTRSYPYLIEKLSKVIPSFDADQLDYREITHYHLFDLKRPEHEEVFRKRIRRMEREHARDGVIVENPSTIWKDFFLKDKYRHPKAIRFDRNRVISPPQLLS